MRIVHKYDIAIQMSKNNEVLYKMRRDLIRYV